MAVDVASKAGTGGARRRARAVRLSTGDRIAVALMVAIPVVVVGGLIWFPTVASVLLSFTSWDGIGGVATTPRGGTAEQPQGAPIHPPLSPAGGAQPSSPPGRSGLAKRLGERPR